MCAGLYALLVLVCTSSYELGKLVSPPEQAVWLAPLGAAVFVVMLIVEGRRETSRQEDLDSESSTSLPQKGLEDLPSQKAA